MSHCPQCNGNEWDIRVIFDTTPGPDNDSGSRCSRARRRSRTTTGRPSA